jgi:hypothetical protein
MTVPKSRAYAVPVRVLYLRIAVFCPTSFFPCSMLLLTAYRMNLAVASVLEVAKNSAVSLEHFGRGVELFIGIVREVFPVLRAVFEAC